VSNIYFLIASGVIAAASIPLIMKFVPPNRLYGFRTPRTLSNPEVWFRVNHFAGWALLVAAAMSASIFVLRPELASGRSFYGLVVFVVPLVLAVGATVAYLRKIR
jgi:hypothetical protein